jgi:hypothetical protein
VVPEFGFGDHIVASEQSDSIDFGVGFLLGGQFAAQYQVLSNLSLKKVITFIWSEESAGSCAPLRLNLTIKTNYEY